MSLGIPRLSECYNVHVFIKKSKKIPVPCRAWNWVHCKSGHSENTNPYLFPARLGFHIDQSEEKK